MIPIDDRGRAFIPFAQKWDKGFKKMGAHRLLQYFEDEDLRENLTEFFEGNFVFAHEKFTEALLLQPEDPTSKQMLARIDAINPDDLPADWDGSVALTSKYVQTELP